MNVIDQLKERGTWSPDFHNLRRHKFHLFFVYDELKREGYQNAILKDAGAKYLGEGKTAQDLYKLKVDRQPILFEDKAVSSGSRGFIYGEVYAVPPELFLYLDKNKLNGVMFQRTKKIIQLLDQVVPHKSGMKRTHVGCFTYVGKEEYFEHRTDLRTLTKAWDVETKKGYYKYKPNLVPATQFDLLDNGWPDEYQQRWGGDWASY